MRQSKGAVSSHHESAVGRDARTAKRDARPRVLVVDDSATILGTVARVLEEEFTVTALVLDATSVVEQWRATRPDVIVLDVAPVSGGFEAAERLRSAGCDLPLVFLSAQEAPEIVRAVWEAGGLAVVARRDVTWDLVAAIRSVLRGRRYVSSAIESR
jgi:DNA-binding NarL/FixJ family response regulator